MDYYTDSYLDQCRKQGDDTADDLVTRIFSDPKRSELFAKIRTIGNQANAMEDLPNYIQDFFVENNQLPAWADVSKMEAGAGFFQKNAQIIMALLGLMSLPFDYAAAPGVQVLYLTNRLRGDVSLRLRETGKFLIDVTDPTAFDPKGKGFSSALKVRLIHAVVRYQLSNSKNWRMEWGVPVNQEDMAGTNLSFSLIPIRGMRKIWQNIPHEQYESYLHLWNVISFIMGVKPELLPETGKEAYWLEKSIRQRHFRKSKEGLELTTNLIQSIEKESRGALSSERIKQYMWFLLGDEIAGILGLDQQVTKPNIETLTNALRNLPNSLNSKSFAQMKQAIAEENVEVSFPGS